MFSPKGKRKREGKWAWGPIETTLWGKGTDQSSTSTQHCKSNQNHEPNGNFPTTTPHPAKGFLSLWMRMNQKYKV